MRGRLFPRVSKFSKCEVVVVNTRAAVPVIGVIVHAWEAAPGVGPTARPVVGSAGEGRCAAGQEILAALGQQPCGQALRRGAEAFVPCSGEPRDDGQRLLEALGVLEAKDEG